MTMNRPGLYLRLGLGMLAVEAGLIGVHAQFFPTYFYREFLFGRGWVQMLPPYNEHITRDLGALYLGFFVLLAFAAVRLSKDLVNGAIVVLHGGHAPAHGLPRAAHRGRAAAGRQGAAGRAARADHGCGAAPAVARDLHFDASPSRDRASRRTQLQSQAPMTAREAASFDVVIVGGRVAGCSLGVHLAAAGLAVAIVEREPVLGDTLSTHVIQDLDLLRRARRARRGARLAVLRRSPRPASRRRDRPVGGAPAEPAAVRATGLGWTARCRPRPPAAGATVADRHRLSSAWSATATGSPGSGPARRRHPPRAARRAGGRRGRAQLDGRPAGRRRASTTSPRTSAPAYWQYYAGRRRCRPSSTSPVAAATSRWPRRATAASPWSRPSRRSTTSATGGRRPCWRRPPRSSSARCAACSAQRPSGGPGAGGPADGRVLPRRRPGRAGHCSGMPGTSRTSWSGQGISDAMRQARSLAAAVGSGLGDPIGSTPHCRPGGWPRRRRPADVLAGPGLRPRRDQRAGSRGAARRRRGPHGTGATCMRRSNTAVTRRRVVGSTVAGRAVASAALRGAVPGTHLRAAVTVALHRELERRRTARTAAAVA